MEAEGKMENGKKSKSITGRKEREEGKSKIEQDGNKIKG